MNAASGSGHVHSTPVRAVFAVLKIMKNVVGARLTGRFRENPFFRPGTTDPVSAPEVLTAAARRALRGDA